MHKFPRSLAMVSVLAPTGVNALGLGDITLHSALNQDLDAEIPLMVSKSESLSDIQVSLASPEAFANVGIERNFSLSNIRFKPVIRPDGSAAIKVTSKGAVREPLLNFLVEVNWPMGRMYREFTVLLDPPVTLGLAPVAFENSGVTELNASRSTIAYSQDSTPSSYPHQGIHYSSATVGPTQRNDTLWDIAKRVQVDGAASHEQVMMALFDHNPHAFNKNNVNTLKVGHVLRVPSYEAIVQRTREEARDEFGRQYDQWRIGVKKRSKRAEGVAEPLKHKELVSQGHLTLDSQTDDIQGSHTGGVTKTTASKAELAMEIADTISQENEELRTRIEELEQQLAKMQRMLTIRSGDLSALQSASSIEAEVGSIADDVDQEDFEAVNPAIVPTEMLEEVEEVIPEIEGINETEKVSSAQPLDSVVKQPPVAAPVQESAKGPVSSPLVKPKQGLLATANPTHLAAAGAGAALLGLLGWVVMRRRRQELNDAMESILAVPPGSSLVADQEQGEKSENKEEQEISSVAESSFLSEFAPSDFDALDSDDDEVDPISEADVYLAYGRYQQAEDLIQQAIEKDPARDACKLKLLEIFFANENSTAFEKYAKELKKYGKDSNTEFWNKVVEMGVELCPASRLFSGELGSQNSISEELEALSEAADSMSDASENQSIDFESNLTDETVSDEDGFSEFNMSTPDESQNALHLDDMEPMAGMDDLSIEEPADNAIDFKLIDDDEGEETIDDIALQFEGEIQKAKIDEPAVEFNKQLDTISELDSVDDATVAFDAVTESREANDAGFEMEAMEVGKSVELSADDTLANLDEIETKLDLAKAYIDMEDEQAARDMLREVMGKGNSAQKNEAEGLIGKLASNG